MRALVALLIVLLLLAALVLIASPASAQDTHTAWTPEHRSIADGLSTALVGMQIGSDVLKAWKSPQRRDALLCKLLTIGASVGVAEAMKHAVNKTRPDGSDNLSFPSEHTMLATSSRQTHGWAMAASVSIAFSTAYFRTAADKHDTVDVSAGAAIGEGIRQMISLTPWCQAR